jgi:hypothetical protein
MHKYQEQVNQLSKKMGVKIPVLFSSLPPYSHHHVDIIQADANLSAADPEYDHEQCTYKGELYSMSEYINIKFGKDIHEEFNALLKKPEIND